MLSKQFWRDIMRMMQPAQECFMTIDRLSSMPLQPEAFRIRNIEVPPAPVLDIAS